MRTSNRASKGKLAQDKCDQMLSRLSPQIDYAGFDKVDMVIEAVIENIELEARRVRRSRKGRPAGLHPGLEHFDDRPGSDRRQDQGRRIAFWGRTSSRRPTSCRWSKWCAAKRPVPQALNSAINLVKQLKKTPVTVGNCVGFLVNRIFFPTGKRRYCWSIMASIRYRFDKAVYDWGMPMGPFRMSDLAGVDVAKFAGGILAKAYSEHNYVSTLVDHLFEAKRFGEKTKVGYYKYDGKKALPDPELAGFIAKARADAGNPPAIEVSDNDIVEHVLFGVVNEACRCLDEGIAIRPRTSTWPA